MLRLFEELQNLHVIFKKGSLNDIDIRRMKGIINELPSTPDFMTEWDRKRLPISLWRNRRKILKLSYDCSVVKL